MPLLIQLLHGSDKDSGLLGNTRGSKSARARAAAALHNIVHSHPDDKRGRREARVLRLLEQIRAHCDQLREMSAEDGEEETENRGGNAKWQLGFQTYSITCLKRPLKKNTKVGFQYRLSLNSGQKYCRMVQGELSAILPPCIKLPFFI